MIKSSIDEFWAVKTIPIGTILHYRDGKDRFVRGIVVPDGEIGDIGAAAFRSIALVGSGWRFSDLPTRIRNGSIRYPHHAAKIINPTNSSLFTPHPTNIFEYYEYVGEDRSISDPRSYTPIDLSVPDMTDEQKVIAAKTILLENIGENMDAELDPDDAIANIVRLLKESGYLSTPQWVSDMI